MSLWHANYFELKVIKAQKIQEEILIFLHLNKVARGTVPGLELPCADRRKPRKIGSSLCLLVSVWPNRHLFTKRLLFYLYVN